MSLPAATARRLEPQQWMQAPWMHAAAARRLLDVLGPQPALFVGGCVRDALLGQAPADIDIATPLLPDEVLRRLRQAGIKAIPTGIAHGTVTALLLPAQFEITTLRRDVATDGRHAEVAFGTDWQADAERRDFTINALYADAEGVLYDPVGGLADLEQGRVRFIGTAASRVAEDYLRVLRFFRFHARFASGAADAEAMAACGAAAQAGALERLSAERVRDELVKILGLPRVVEALSLMQQSGVLDALLPGHRFAPMVFERLVALSDDAWLRLVALLPRQSPEQSVAAIERLKLSRAQQHRMEVLTAPAPFDWSALTDEAAWPSLFYAHGAEYCRDHAILMALEDVTRLDLLPRLIDAATRYRRPVFPLRGADLLKHGVQAGPGVSYILKELEAWWRDGGFAAGREACLAEMRLRIRFAGDEPPPEEEQPKPPAEV